MNLPGGKKIVEYLLYFLSFSLPFNGIISNIITILLIITIVFSIKFVQNISNLDKDKKILLVVFILLYIIQIAGLINTQNFTNGFFVLEKTLSILLFPLIFISIGNLGISFIKRILKIFVLSCFIATIICLFNALLINYSQNGLTGFLPDLYDTSMTNIIGISHVYFGMYLVFCLIIISINFINCKMSFLTNKKNIAKLTLIVYFLFFLLLLGSKASVFSFLFIVLSYITIWMFMQKRIILGIALISVIVLAVYSGINLFPKTKVRFTALMKMENYQAGDKRWNNIASRVSTFKCTNEVIKENFWFGVGTGDCEMSLNRCYLSYGYISLMNLNPHNQYMQFALRLGVFGFLLFIACLLIPARLAIKQRNYIYLSFLALFALSCLTESMLERNKGIVFYAFFNSLFAFHYLTNENQSKNKKLA